MAVKTFAVVERRVEFDVRRFRSFSEILYPDVVHASPFCLVISEHRVIGVACETGVIAGNKVILEVRCGEVALVVQVKTLLDHLCLLALRHRMVTEITTESDLSHRRASTTAVYDVGWRF